jgi:hypothetical protein
MPVAQLFRKKSCKRRVAEGALAPGANSGQKLNGYYKTEVVQWIALLNMSFM